ncbi:Tautomerase/MIF superfamily [Dichotomocladium elegans]|nr:Tautomerase/MIF superfamily [Dichotomocladium elegans]
MPALEITSEHAPKDLDSFLAKLSALFAEAIGKPESYCMVTFTKVDRVYFNGKAGNSFLAKVTSIGNIDNNRNSNLTKVIGAELEKELGISLDRGYFFFNNVTAEDTGYKGTTFYNLLKG